MRRIAFVLAALLAALPARAGVATPAERDRTLRALDAAQGRYEETPEALRWEKLTVDGKTLPRARVRSADTWTATLYFDRGIRTVPLAKLPATAQALLGYDPKGPPSPPATAVPAARPLPVSAEVPSEADDPVARVLAAYGEKPTPRREVDLRPEFERRGLLAKDQGESPSCSAFAIVCALEFHLAKTSRLPGRLSEDFLVWASLRSLGQTRDRIERFGGEERLADGFTLVEVAQALRSHGIPLRARMPAGFDPRRDTPPDAAARDAALRRRVNAVELSGRTPRARLEQLVLALNEGIPVAVGIRWPADTPVLRATGALPESPSPAGRGHAVVITGYTCADGLLEHTVFRFRNSYGARWGDAGYGTVSWKYLLEHCHGGVFLDLR